MTLAGWVCVTVLALGVIGNSVAIVYLARAIRDIADRPGR